MVPQSPAVRAQLGAADGGGMRQVGVMLGGRVGELVRLRSAVGGQQGRRQEALVGRQLHHPGISGGQGLSLADWRTHGQSFAECYMAGV